jgi:hypothetical protein
MNAPIRASDHIWGLVCGFSEPVRSRRPLLMLSEYIDDSTMNSMPVSVLGGWIGSAKDWAAFSDEWQEALWMKPRLRYFKLSEAQNLRGEFSGWSEESRYERIRLLIKIIERYRLLGVTSAMPTAEYKEVFGPIPDNGIKNPYFLSFFGITAHLAGYFQGLGHNEPIDFIFDIQPGQVELVVTAWESFLQAAPDEIRPLLGDYPIFRSDAKTIPLQAADMGAGWSRQLAEDHFHGRPNRAPPWGDMQLDINVIGRYWTKQMMLDLRGTLDLSAFGLSGL